MIVRDAPVTSSWFIWPSGRRDPMAWSVISIGSQVPVVSRVLAHVISRAIVTDERIRTASSAKSIEMLQPQQRYSAFLEPHRCWCLMLTGDTKRASRALTAGLTQVRHSKSGTNFGSRTESSGTRSPAPRILRPDGRHVGDFSREHQRSITCIRLPAIASGIFRSKSSGTRWLPAGITRGTAWSFYDAMTPGDSVVRTQLSSEASIRIMALPEHRAGTMVSGVSAHPGTAGPVSCQLIHT